MIFVVLVVVVAYFAVVLWWARWLFGVWRARHIDKDTASPFHDPVSSFEELWRGGTMLGAFVTALLWPLSLPGLVAAHFVGRFMGGTSVRSRLELETERDAMAKRITELERDLGIGRQR